MNTRKREASDITRSEEPLIPPDLIPSDYVQEGELSETPVSEEVAQQKNLEENIRQNVRAHLAVSVLRECADHIENAGRLIITPLVGGNLLGVVVVMMQASSWKKSAGLRCFETVWGTEESDDGKTN